MSGAPSSRDESLLPAVERATAGPKRSLVIHPNDGVAVALVELAPGETLPQGEGALVVAERIPAGHKLALRAHEQGELVVKYGHAIGRATRAIAPGEHVHSHNLETRLTPDAAIDYSPRAASPAPAIERTWRGLLREDGRAATRNELWIVPTVGCVARTAQALAASFRERLHEFPNLDGVHA
ncbi:MAG TPA: UxaA family hydrolase, partial [Polyangiaceae bacterium]